MRMQIELTRAELGDLVKMGEIYPEGFSIRVVDE